MDPTARAYAILGLEKGCAPDQLKPTYRRLVKRWHPDRFVADPAGQAEASARLREINGAFRIVAEDLGAIRRPFSLSPCSPWGLFCSSGTGSDRDARVEANSA